MIYLVFNEGYLAAEGPKAVRADLCAEAIRLGRLLVDLLPDAEALGLLALMLLHQAREAGRVDGNGELVLLEDQDRSLWDRGAIEEARVLISRVFAGGEVGAYALQAAIAAVHSDAPSFSETDWPRIFSLYDLLIRADPSPVALLNRAVALAMRHGPDVGLAAIDDLMAKGALETYALAHAARADLQRRLGQRQAARASYCRARELSTQPAERRLLERRIAALTP